MSEFNDFNNKIIAEFRANEGRVGGPFAGAPMVLVHHLGARSGTERVAPLVHFPQPDGSMLIIASKGGAPTNPDWYHNLKANPEGSVTIEGESYSFRAVEAEGERRERIWKTGLEIYPGFSQYAERASHRHITVFVLDQV